MNNRYIVRADYYPDGNIIPLGINDLSGTTFYIEQVCSVKKKISATGQLVYKFVCIADKKKITLLFKNNKWDCSFNEE